MQTVVRKKFTWLLTGQIGENETVRSIPIDSSPFRVGRSSQSTLCIPRPTISNLHAEFNVEEESLRVRDLGSTNGTFLNGVRIHEELALSSGNLVQIADVVFRIGQETTKECGQTLPDDAADRALALIQFDQLMAEQAVVPFFQPIVTFKGKRTFAYEVLGRSRLFGLNEPSAMFKAAAVLNAQSELSRLFRLVGVREGQALAGAPMLFLNTHPDELAEPELLEFSLRELRDVRPTEPLVLEIHETAVTEPAAISRLRDTLRDLNMQLAYDDFGAGQARFVELAEVPPDYLKFDLKLIQGIQHAPQHRLKLLENLVHMTQDMGIVPLAEGIECQEEHETCEQLGFVLAQGFLYGRPAGASRLSDPKIGSCSIGATAGTSAGS